MNALQLATFFHDTYEQLAPSFDYKTREDTRDFSQDTNNGKLMIAVCQKLLDKYLVVELVNTDRY